MVTKRVNILADVEVPENFDIQKINLCVIEKELLNDKDLDLSEFPELLETTYHEIKSVESKKGEISKDAQQHIKEFLVEYGLSEECWEGADDKISDELIDWFHTKWG